MIRKKRDESKWRMIRVPVRLAEGLEALASMWNRQELDIGATIDTPGRVSDIALHEVISELLRRDAAHRHRARKSSRGGRSWDEIDTDQDTDQDGESEV